MKRFLFTTITALVTAALLTATPAHAACWNFALPWGRVTPTAYPRVFAISSLDYDQPLTGVHAILVIYYAGSQTRSVVHRWEGNYWRNFTFGPGHYGIWAVNIDQCGRAAGENVVVTGLYVK